MYALSLENMRALLMCIVFVVACLPLGAQEITLSTTAQKYAIAYPYYLEDRNASLNFEEITKEESRFIRAQKKVPDFLGNFSKAIWYRFEIFNNSNTDDWYLEIKGGFMNLITVYQVEESGKVRSLTLSGDNNFHLKPVRSSNLVFPVPLSKGTGTTLYVRATSKTLIRTSMSFSTMQQLYEDNTFISYGDGFFTAVAVALLLYNLFVYFSLREKAYLYYIGYISMAILHNNVVAGHIQVFLPWLDWLNTTTLIPAMSFFSILFSNSFLQTRQHAPFIYKMQLPLILLCLVPLVCYTAGWYRLAILMSAMLIFILFVYWLCAGITAYRKGFAPAIFYIIGFGALVFLSVVFELKMRGWLEESYWTDSSLFIGVALEAIVLSFALASKINFYKKEKERLQEQAYQQAIHFSRELIQTQEAERKRIASELHDSLGQKLVLIKNKILKAALPGAVAQQDDSLPGNVAEAIQEIRSISYGLRPYQIDLLGLTSSVNSLAEESFDAAGIDFTTTIDNIDGIFDNDDSINIYRIVQECINNIIKHSTASHADISIKRSGAEITITIKDNGSGFDTGKNYSGFGLKGIKERLHILKGTVTIKTLPLLGTSFQFHIPVSNHHT